MKWYEKQKKEFDQSVDNSQEGTTLFNKHNDTINTLEAKKDDDYIIDFEPVYDGNIQGIYHQGTIMQTACEDTEGVDINSDILSPEKANINYTDKNINMDEEEEEILPLMEEDIIAPINTALSTIVKDTQVTGNIDMDGFLDIYGDVIGDITCSGDIHLYGKIEGNIVCRSLFVQDANIEGDIKCLEEVDIMGDSTVKGTITSNDLTTEGKILGNLQIQNHIMLTKHAVIDGSIHSKTLETEKGASVKGFVTTS